MQILLVCSRIVVRVYWNVVVENQSKLLDPQEYMKLLSEVFRRLFECVLRRKKPKKAPPFTANP